MSRALLATAGEGDRVRPNDAHGKDWEQPTKKNNAVYFKLQQKYKYLKLMLIDDDDETEDEDEDLAVPLSKIQRLIETVKWKTGKGNSYVVTAVDVDPTGKPDPSKTTEYKIDTGLLGII